MQNGQDSILLRIKKFLWGELTLDELKKFGMLGFTLMFILGSYWLMRPLKDGIFGKMVGVDYLPYAKMLSVFIIIPLALGYSKLVDLVAKQKLFYVICSVYGILFAGYAWALAHPLYGFANPVPSPRRLLGWMLYVSIESFGTLAVSLFWSFVVSFTDSAAAKRGYGFIIFLAQIGTITGPYLAMQAPRIGLPGLALIVAGAVMIIPLMIKAFIIVYPSAAESHTASKKKTGALEGLKLIFANPYLIGVLGVSTLYEISGTILDFSMKNLAAATYASPEDYTRFLGMFGMSINSLSLVLSLLGTSYFIRTYGLTFCLVMYPLLTSVCMFGTWLFSDLWVFFGVMVIHRALTYALNNPCKEILYIPTSKDVKFKAKSWLDMFGARLAKASGAGAVGFLQFVSTGLSGLLFFGPLVGIAMNMVWLGAAFYVGTTNKKLTDAGKIIE